MLSDFRSSYSPKHDRKTQRFTPGKIDRPAGVVDKELEIL